MTDDKEITVIIECQKCGSYIGAMQAIKGKDMLVVNGIAVTYMRGVCVKCGKEFYWDVGLKGLSKLLGNGKI